jgi:hypothetical protein
MHKVVVRHHNLSHIPIAWFDRRYESRRMAEKTMADNEGVEIRLEDLLDLDEQASPGSNAERARQQAEFHAREVRELDDLIAADRSGRGVEDRTGDPRLAERTQHRTLELLCQEIAQAFEWLGQRDRPSTDLDFGLEQIRASYETSLEISLLRKIAETEYPLLTSISVVRQNGVGLLPETQLALKHAARGRPLADALSIEGAHDLLASWLKRAVEIGPDGSVHVPSVRGAIDWLLHLSAERATPGSARSLEDDIEAMIYLARATLGEAGFEYAGPEEPAPGY